ncbi:hypothetical protein O181_070640 [Austropuccinia psidii MF-1]|uniref:Translation machinery-associated protein 16 n=1 Tax=Austropuccinia psidii MF-1 TaxID=1389203 RepID=A0A9Q3EWW2_9BASI|nr:hypothetical protein [Austropuccinia psidii MF-1]
MPNNRIKTFKSLTSKKSKLILSNLNPNSRRSKQFNRVLLRDEKLKKEKNDRKKIESLKVNRLIWFYDYLKLNNLNSLKSLNEVHNLIENYINRNFNEIEIEKSKRIKGRSKSLLQEKLEIESERDENEYSTSGFVVPDLVSPENVMLLRQWSEKRGDPSFLPRIRLLRLFKNDMGTVVEEQKGASHSIKLDEPIVGNMDCINDVKLDNEDQQRS